MPIYSDNQANTFSHAAWRFTYKFNLGDIERAIPWHSDRTLFAGFVGPTIAYKFTKRPGFYRIHYNVDAKSYETYWMNVKGLLAA